MVSGGNHKTDAPRFTRVLAPAKTLLEEQPRILAVEKLREDFQRFRWEDVHALESIQARLQ